MALSWRVFCERCDWRIPLVASRDEGKELGYAHVAWNHSDDEEWEFRVQGWTTSTPKRVPIVHLVNTSRPWLHDWSRCGLRPSSDPSVVDDLSLVTCGSCRRFAEL